MNYACLPEGKLHYTRYDAVGRDTRTLCNRHMSPDKDWWITSAAPWRPSAKVARRLHVMCKDCRRIHER